MVGALRFLPMVVGAIVWGPNVPFDLAALTGWSDGAAVKGWSADFARVLPGGGEIPVWLLLQPRGQLGGYFLYAALEPGRWGWPSATCRSSTRRSVAGIRVAPIGSGWRRAGAVITIVCGACSGFHALIARTT